jgi:diguanylate cyclase (GGDEF)-like protein
VALPAQLGFARSRRLAVIGFVGVIWLLCALLLACGLIGSSATALVNWLETWGTAAAFWCGAAACAWRSRASPSDRVPWAWVAAACTLWAFSNSYYALVLAPAEAPIPSPLDIGYMLFPIALGVALVWFARARLARLSVDAVTDGAVVALGTAALVTALMFDGTGAHTDSLPAVITTLVYPIEDIALLSIVAGLGSVLAWRLGRDWTLVAAGIVAITIADVLAFSNVLNGDSTGGAWTNLGWTTGIALMALGAWLTIPEPAVSPASLPAGVRIAIPIGFGAIAVAVLALAKPLDLPASAIVLSVLAIAASFARLYRSFRQSIALADSRRLSMTDPLTGLPNRRRLMHDLETVFASGEPATLAMFDLDGFKLFNDTFGHVAGDGMLHELARRLQAVAAPTATAYRLGGDEFCVIAPAGSAGRDVVEAVGAALEDSGEGWTITSSVGTVDLPAEAAEIAVALQMADRRMYERKARRPEAARRQASDVLLSAIGHQQPALEKHAQDATALVAAVARALNLSEDEVDDVIRAGELHDVGKLAIPQEILTKPGPLDPEEWEIMRRHTIIGEEMLRAAPALIPIAPLVRASHERWDGHGYPDGLSGESIPIGARIVAVCDAFDAMVSDRPYRSGLTVRDALAETIRCAGEQFDPRVVDAFISVQESFAPTAPAPPLVPVP